MWLLAEGYCRAAGHMSQSLGPVVLFLGFFSRRIPDVERK